MDRHGWRVAIGVLTLTCISQRVLAQTALSWSEVRARFMASNPTLRAGRIGIDESRATEITAFLRPNPQATVTNDQIDPLNTEQQGRLSNLISIASVSYLHERQHKRELRLESAQRATSATISQQADLERTLLFSLRSAFVQILQAKAVSTLTRETLTSFDRLLALSRDRLQAGDISQVDLDRLELQRQQFETDAETAAVNLRTSKIQLLALLNDRSSVDQFDVDGPFDEVAGIPALDGLRQAALANRPDLKAAADALEKAQVDHRLAFANGSTDPIISVDAGLPQSPESYTPPLHHYVGLAVTVPLRIFDRNQGEKLRTELDVTRNVQLVEAARAQVFSDVDSAYASLVSTASLVQSYKARYLEQATRVRETMTFSYQRGGASLLDFLQAEQEYRTIQLSYVNLIGAHLAAVSQLNRAVGQEVIP